jgi:UDP-glucose 4-epimerase
MEVKLAACSAEKARSLLGYKTTYTLEDGLRELIRYIESRGPKPFKYHLDIEIRNEKTPSSWINRLF